MIGATVKTLLFPAAVLAVAATAGLLHAQQPGSPALEVLVATPAIRHLIRDDKVHQIYGAMQTGQDRAGMQTMNQSLVRLIERRLISRDVALGISANREELASLLERAFARGSR